MPVYCKGEAFPGTMPAGEDRSISKLTASFSGAGIFVTHLQVVSLFNHISNFIYVFSIHLYFNFKVRWLEMLLYGMFSYAKIKEEC